MILISCLNNKNWTIILVFDDEYDFFSPLKPIYSALEHF